MMASGTAPVAIEVLGSPESMAPASAFPQK